VQLRGIERHFKVIRVVVLYSADSGSCFGSY